MILSLTSTALQQESKPGSLYYRHPEYTVRWWWREFNRISYLGGREYLRPTRLTVEFDWPIQIQRNADGTVQLDGNGRPMDITVSTDKYPSMLHRHNREKLWEYENRRRRAHYHNIVATTINMLVSHALKKGVQRDGDEELVAFWGAVDCKRKQDMDSFLREGIRHAEVEGIMWCFADVEQKDAENPDADGKPYVYWVNPLDIFDWSVDEDGELVWIKQFVYLEAPRTPLEGIRPVHRFRVWYRDRIEEFDCDPQNGQPTSAAPTITPHTFGRVPCEPLYAKRNTESNFPDGEPLASDLAKSANAIFNYTSLLDEILYKQTFSQLVLPTTQFDAIQLGLSTFIGYDPLTAGGKVEYIAPDAEQARVLMEAIVSELEHARQAFGVGRGRSDGSMQKSSGDALELESEDKRSMLADIASSCSDFENRLVGLFNAMRAAQPAKEAAITYPTEFDTRAFKDEVNEALSLQSVGMSPEIMLAIRKQLASRKLAGLPEEERQMLIDTLKATDPPPAVPPSGPGGGPAAPGDRNKLTPAKSVGSGSTNQDPNQPGTAGQGEPPP